jgi:hypothetical protein
MRRRRRRMMRCAIRLLSSRRVGHRFLDIIARCLFVLLRRARYMRARLSSLLQKKPVIGFVCSEERHFALKSVFCSEERVLLRRACFAFIS